jgi:transposase
MQTQRKQLDFSGQNFYCGIDTHKRNWTVTIQTNELVLKTFVQDPEPSILYNYLWSHYPGGNYIIGYEAGYFGYCYQRSFESLGIKCFVLHPADIPTSQKDKEQKRDARDSRKIASTLKNNDMVPVWVPPLGLEQDRQLLRTREKLTSDQTRVKNRIKAVLQINGIKYPESFKSKGSHWSAHFIQWLNDIQFSEPSATEAMRSKIRHLVFIRSEMLNLLRQIRTLSRTDRYRELYNKLIQISGIGMVTGMTILTETGDIRRFKRPDNYRAFLGVIPRAHDSGDKERPGGITKRANSHLRYLLIEATWIAIRSNPYYLNIYQGYRKRLETNVALVRTTGKLANQIYFSLKNESMIK